jgi:replication factor C small subunit
MSKQLWYTKHTPKTIEEYIFKNEDTKTQILSYFENKDIPHLLLHGSAGTGKTSLAFLIKEIFQMDDADFLVINGSDENNVDTMRSKVQNFISAMPLSFDYKIVFVNEADGLSAGAQKILRGKIEDYSDNARFIFTCNYPNNLTPELRSRFTPIKFDSLDKEEMLMRFATILKKEKVKIDSLDVLDEYVDNCYPDFRVLLTTAQAAVRNNKLMPFSSANLTAASEHMLGIVEFITNDQWDKARTYLAENIPDNKWEDCYKFLYDYLHEIGKFTDTKKWKAGIVVIADHLYRHSFVADREINFASCLIKLSEI